MIPQQVHDQRASFLAHYWLAFLWLGTALAVVLMAALVYVGRSPTNDSLVAVGILSASLGMLRALLNGWRERDNGFSDTGDRIAALLIQIAVTAVLWPVIESFWQLIFLQRAHRAWKDGAILVDESGNAVRSGR